MKTRVLKQSRAFEPMVFCRSLSQHFTLKSRLVCLFFTTRRLHLQRCKLHLTPHFNPTFLNLSEDFTLMVFGNVPTHLGLQNIPCVHFLNITKHLLPFAESIVTLAAILL
mmetsp:Transcript_88855/g.236599  ORF Transcript_88855/g.236599 Transcript_88855/m.236599 type:complete len:110 (+) Transcript_88855:488-817(+)